MMKSKTDQRRGLVSHSSQELKKLRRAGKGRTDWRKIGSMRDDEINLSDSPELTPEMFARAVVRDGLKPVPPKTQLTLRLDADVLNWFKAKGHGYQTRINALLRAYKEMHG